MHPVISVVTLTTTGVLCYAGQVFNYYVKVLEWFRGLPAVLRDKYWFLIKRRESILSTSAESRQKKPTTANRHRLEAAIAETKFCLPNVYRDSVLLPEELDKFPFDGEVKMVEQAETVDLNGDVHMDTDMFSAWLSVSHDGRTVPLCKSGSPLCHRSTRSGFEGSSCS